MPLTMYRFPVPHPLLTTAYTTQYTPHRPLAQLLAFCPVFNRLSGCWCALDEEARGGGAVPAAVLRASEGENPLLPATWQAD